MIYVTEQRNRKMARTVEILEDDDILNGSDWCRPLMIVRDGQSDYVSDTNPYGGNPINNMKWCRVRDIMPFFVRKTVGEYKRRSKNLRLYVPYEFVRGDLPVDHTLPDKR